MHASQHNIYYQHDIYCSFFAVTDPMTTKLKIYPQQHPSESTILHQFSAKTIFFLLGTLPSKIPGNRPGFGI